MSPASWTREASRAAGDPPLDRVVFESPTVRVAAFRCPAWHPLFKDSGAIQSHVFVFPRHSVELRHEGKAAFLADPGVVTLYNRGQRYLRQRVSAEGDHCEWFAVAPRMLLDAVRHQDPRIEDQPETPFRYPYGPCPPRTYLAQRALFDRLRAGGPVDPLLIEETVVGLLAEVLAEAYAFWGSSPRPPGPSRRQQEAVEHVRRLLSAKLEDPLLLSDLAGEVGVSVFHLCRAFRAATGSTIHAYRNRLRLQRALARLADGDELTDVALDLGYSSHSHFTEAFRRLFGVTPSGVRTHLTRRTSL